MADKKSKREAKLRKVSRTEPKQPNYQPDGAISSAEQRDADMRRLLREAAWTRMFGKAAAPRNPFTR
jgi:hypothetical protein